MKNKDTQKDKCQACEWREQEIGYPSKCGYCEETNQNKSIEEDIEKLIKIIGGIFYPSLRKEGEEAIRQSFLHITAKAKEEGYKERDNELYEEKEIDEVTEAHKTEEGYCCACEYDLSVFYQEIEKAKEEERERIKNIVVDNAPYLFMREYGWDDYDTANMEEMSDTLEGYQNEILKAINN